MAREENQIAPEAGAAAVSGGRQAGRWSRSWTKEIALRFSEKPDIEEDHARARRRTLTFSPTLLELTFASVVVNLHSLI